MRHHAAKDRKRYKRRYLALKLPERAVKEKTEQNERGEFTSLTSSGNASLRRAPSVFVSKKSIHIDLG